MLWHGQSVNISLILRRAEYSSEESAVQQCGSNYTGTVTVPEDLLMYRNACIAV